MEKYKRCISVICIAIALACRIMPLYVAYATEDTDTADSTDSEASITDISEDIPDVYIKAINPGYKIGDKNNVGEMIEMARIPSDEPLSLAGFTIGYTNSSGNYSTIFEFPDNSWMLGESIVLRLASAPDSGQAAVNYSKTLAFSAGLDLK